MSNRVSVNIKNSTKWMWNWLWISVIINRELESKSDHLRKISLSLNFANVSTILEIRTEITEVSMTRFSPWRTESVCSPTTRLVPSTRIARDSTAMPTKSLMPAASLRTSNSSSLTSKYLSVTSVLGPPYAAPFSLFFLHSSIYVC